MAGEATLFEQLMVEEATCICMRLNKLRMAEEASHFYFGRRLSKPRVAGEATWV